MGERVGLPGLTVRSSDGLRMHETTAQKPRANTRGSGEGKRFYYSGAYEYCIVGRAAALEVPTRAALRPRG